MNRENKRLFFLIVFVFWVLSILLSTSRSAESAELEFIYPTEGMTFHANETITVRLSASPETQFSEIVIKHVAGWGLKTDLPYEFDIDLPDEVGSVKIIALGRKQNGHFSSAEVTIHLITPPLPEGVTITQLRVFPPQLSFNYISENYGIDVRGIFSNDPVEHEITDPIFGTTYQVKSGGESVVSVSPRGRVTAKGVGTDIILVSNNGMTVEVPVTVQSANSPPAIEPIDDITMQAGEVVEIPIKAVDADGDSLTLKVFNVPRFGQFTDNGNGTGLLRLAPGDADRAYEPITIMADDNGPLKLRGREKFLLRVLTPESGIADQDSDGVPDANDNCVAVSNPNQTDGDGDGTGDACDGCPADPVKVQAGVCGCGTTDADSDGDGTPNCNDQCPGDSQKTAPGACGCGIADTDGDGDGVADCNDNCPAVANSDQTDSNHDGTGDACSGSGKAENCGNCVDDDTDGLVDQLDPDCPSSPLSIKKGALTLQPDANEDKVELAGRFSARADSINPPTEGMTVSLIDTDGVITCLSFPPGGNWKTKPGPQWSFDDPANNPRKIQETDERISVKFNKGAKAFDVSVKVKKADLTDADAGNVSTAVRIGEKAFLNTQAWQLSGKGKKLSTK